MALNPPLNQSGLPFRLEREFILAERKGMEVQLKVKSMSKLSQKGKVYLTTARMIFVSKNYKKDKFKALDMPIGMMKKFKFKQPVFGSNYLEFEVKPLLNLLPDTAHVKLWFTEGGCDKFLQIFEHISKEIFQQKKQGKLSNRLQKEWQQGTFNKHKGFQDPDDPTVILTDQPQVFNPNADYIGNNIYMDKNVDYPIFEQDTGPNQNYPDFQNQDQNNNNPNPNNNYAPNLNNPNQQNNPNPNPNYQPHPQNQQQNYNNYQNMQQHNQNPQMNQQYPNHQQNPYPNNMHPNNMPNPNNMHPNNMPNPNNMYPNNMHQNNMPNPNNMHPNNMLNPNQQGFQPQYQNNQNFAPNPNNPNMPYNPNMPNNPNMPYNPMQHIPQSQNPNPVMENVQNQNQGKYFGWFGPKLKKND